MTGLVGSKLQFANTTLLLYMSEQKSSKSFDVSRK